MPTPSIVGIAESAMNGLTPRTVVVPSGTEVDDLLIVVLATNDADIVPPAGWDAIKTNVDTGTLRTSVYSRVRAVGDTNYVFTVGTSVSTCWLIVALRGVGTFSAGTEQTRAASGGTTTITAPSLSVIEDDSLVLAFGTERTTATESGITSASNSFTEVAWVGHHSGVSSLETVWCGSKIIDTGSSGAVDILYPNTQSLNGLAWQMQFQGVTVGTIEVEMWDGDELVPGNVYVFDGTDEIAVTEIIALPPSETSYSIAQMDDDFENDILVYWAHRGLSLEASEMTMRAYTDAIFHGFKVLEYSTHKTSDGVFVGMHDTTVDRTTALTGTVVSKAWSDLNGIAVDQALADGGTVSRLEDLLDTYGQTHVLVIEDKTYTSLTALIALINGHIPDAQDRVVLKFSGESGTGFAIAAHAAGFKTWGYFYDGEVTTEMPTKAVNYDYLGLNYNASEGNWDIALAYDKPVIAHIVPNDIQGAIAVGKGAKGLQCSAAFSV